MSGLFGQPGAPLPEVSDGPVPQNVWLVGQTRSRDQRAGRYADRVLHTQKMVPELARRMLGHTRLPSGAFILDPFLGTGTTAVECEMFGYRCRGSDRVPEYVEESVLNAGGGPGHHDLRVADATELPWETASCDGCVCSPPYGDSDPYRDSNGDSIVEKADGGSGYAQMIVRTSGFKGVAPKPVRGLFGAMGRKAWECSMFLAMTEIRRCLKPGAFCLMAVREYWHRKGRFELIDAPGRLIDIGREAGLLPYDIIYALDSAIDQYGTLTTRASVHQLSLARRMADKPCPRGVPGVTRVLIFRRRDRKNARVETTNEPD